jgi:hypothetical protein
VVREFNWNRFLTSLWLATWMAHPGTAQATDPSAPLLIRNSFSTPEETLRHFLGRDESGAYWAGMLDPERRAFTTWPHAPQSETFLNLKSRSIGATRQIASDEVAIPVTLTLGGHQDAFGTQVPTRDRKNTVHQVFRMKRVSGQWKIVQPEANNFIPAIRVNSR